MHSAARIDQENTVISTIHNFLDSFMLRRLEHAKLGKGSEIENLKISVSKDSFCL